MSTIKSVTVKNVPQLESLFKGEDSVNKAAYNLAYDKPVRTSDGRIVKAEQGFKEYLYDVFLPSLDGGGSAIENDNS